MEWAALLGTHPDPTFVDYILTGMREGFRVGFLPSGRLKSARRNFSTAEDHASVVQNYLDLECSLGRVVGPVEPESLPGIHVSSFGVIPKWQQPGKWRLIVDLSRPEGASVNDGISSHLCSMTYMRVDDVADAILKIGQGAEMAKIDIQSAYRIVPVHPGDRWLLGMMWQGKLYVDMALPFGLRSAPKIFSVIADGLEWILRANGAPYTWHYLDDFITIGAPNSGECAFNRSLMSHMCRRLGVPLAQDKCEGPTTCLTFLGIEVDSVALELRLPERKLAELWAVLAEWRSGTSRTKKDLDSLAGKLQHAATVVRPGRTFLRRIYNILATTKKPHHHIPIRSGLKSDLAWWHTFLESWNGTSMLLPSKKASPDTRVVSDASGSWGCGAYWGDKWFQLQWEPSMAVGNLSIALKELVPIIMAATAWGRYWRGLVVQCCSDNKATVAVLNTRTSKDNDIMHLLRCLFFFEAYWEFCLVAAYIPGPANGLADDLSRGRSLSFLSKVPQANLRPTTIHEATVNLLLRQKPDWTSATWRQEFSTILSGA